MRQFLLCTIWLTLTGCAPALLLEQSKVVGKITEPNNGKPIEGVKVYCDKYPERFTFTNSNGIFEIPEVRNWGIAELGSDHLTGNCTLNAQARGYCSVVKRVWFGDDTLQTVILEPM